MGQNGFGAVGNYDNRDPWFESHRQQNFLFICQLDKRDEDKKPEMAQFFFFMKLFIFLLTLVEKKLKLKLERNRMKKWEWEISFQWTINFSLTTTALTPTEGKKVKDYS